MSLDEDRDGQLQRKDLIEFVKLLVNEPSSADSFITQPNENEANKSFYYDENTREFLPLASLKEKERPVIRSEDFSSLNLRKIFELRRFYNAMDYDHKGYFTTEHLLKGISLYFPFHFSIQDHEEKN